MKLKKHAFSHRFYAKLNMIVETYKMSYARKVSNCSIDTN
jgi:hypothetical protein